MKFLIATKNTHKLIEIKRILTPMGIEVISVDDLKNGLKDVEENGKSFEENALIKARNGCNETGYVTVADDSGICVDALSGAPGIFSARFAGEPCDDEANNRKLLNLLKDIDDGERTAKYVAVIACVFPDGREFTVRGECHGIIAKEPKGSNGFGYDPLFISELGCFGEVSSEIKDSISHRHNALIKFSEKLKEYI